MSLLPFSHLLVKHFLLGLVGSIILLAITTLFALCTLLASSDSSFHILPISERIWVAFISKYHNKITICTRIRLFHTCSLLGTKAHIAAKRSLGLTLFRGSLLRLAFAGLSKDYPHSPLGTASFPSELIVAKRRID